MGLCGRVVMQRPAKPCTPVRFRPQPPKSSIAQVAKQVDARDLKSLGPKVRAGSIPALGTKYNLTRFTYIPSLFIKLISNFKKKSINTSS